MPGHALDAYDIEELQRRGLTDPIPQIISSLMSHGAIIPQAGVLGGTMGFYSAESIHVLDDSWVYAEFEDGHIQGRGIFEYTIQADSTIAWKVVLATKAE